MKTLVMITSLFSLFIAGQAQTDFQYYNIALVKYNMGDYEGARADLSKAIALNPNHTTALNLRGMANYNLKDFSGAIADYSAAIEVFTRRSGTVSLTIYDHRGNIVESQKSEKANPDLAVPYYNRGVARYSIEDYEGAGEDYTKALENEPEMVNAYYNRGYTRYELDDKEGACSDWQKAFEMGLPDAGEMVRVNCPTEPERDN